MTTRYQNEHYEAVAYIFATRGMPDVVRTQLTGDFADLFAADNPRRCEVCGHREPADEEFEDHKHSFEGGFDRAKFLSACGLGETK